MHNPWIVMVALLSLSACGLKGALYLPPQPAPTAPPVTPDAKASTPSATVPTTTDLPSGSAPMPTSSPYSSLPVTP